MGFRYGKIKLSQTARLFAQPVIPAFRPVILATCSDSAGWPCGIARRRIQFLVVLGLWGE